jgi:hypothetical protein
VNFILLSLVASFETQKIYSSIFLCRYTVLLIFCNSVKSLQLFIFVHECSASYDVLTPSHFLNGQRLTTLPNGPEPAISKDLRREATYREKLQEDFLRRWKKEYLLDLRSYHEVRNSRRRPTACRVGDIVLLQDDVRPRHMWQRARIMETKPGTDGRVRTLILRPTKGTNISRPVQLVTPLEVDQGGEDVGDQA